MVWRFAIKSEYITNCRTLNQPLLFLMDMSLTISARPLGKLQTGSPLSHVCADDAIIRGVISSIPEDTSGNHPGHDAAIKRSQKKKWEQQKKKRKKKKRKRKEKKEGEGESANIRNQVLLLDIQPGGEEMGPLLQLTHTYVLPMTISAWGVEGSLIQSLK